MAGRHTVHLETRGFFFFILWITGLGGLAAVAESLRYLPASGGWTELTLGAAMIAVAVGIWRAKEWARWVAGSIAVGYGAWALASLVLDALRDHTLGTLAGLPCVAWMAFVAWYSFRPAARRRFAEAREAIARSRAPHRS